jgi:hypothetical protein
MRAALRRDQLGADPDHRADPAHATFEHIAHAELAAMSRMSSALPRKENVDFAL